MTSISVGSTRMNIKIAEPANTQPVQKAEKQQEEIKLRGITFRNDNPSPPQDVSNITPLENGSVPADNELPDIFSDNSQNNIPQQQDYNQPTLETPAKSSGNSEMTTGIGMAVGGVSGALLGKKFGFTKLGIAVGVAVGGFIGNKIGQ